MGSVLYIRVRFEDPPLSINFVNTNLIKIKLGIQYISVYLKKFQGRVLRLGQTRGPSAAAIG